MLLYICIFGCLLLLAFDFYYFKDLKTPTFMYGVVWLVIYLSLLPQQLDYIQNNPLLPSFFISFVLFFCGFYIICSKPSYLPTLSNSFDLEWNPITKKIVFIVEYILSIIIFISCYSVVSISQFSAWRAVRQGMSEADFFPAWTGLALTPVRIISFVSYALYLYTPNKENKNAFFISLPPVLLTALFTTRGDWLMIIITLAYIFLYVKKVPNKKIFSIGLISFIGFVLIFIYSSFDKYQYRLTNMHMDEIELLKGVFSSYFVNPILNFFDWFENNPEYAGGKYTFRFIVAIAASLFPDIEVVSAVLEFRCINGTYSNVYTSLNWLARDFGIWWALIVQFFLGLIFGYLYNRYMKKDEPHLITLIMLSMLMMPIANQFFDDKIFSIASIWLQRLLFCCVLVKTCVIVRKRPI